MARVIARDVYLTMWVATSAQNGNTPTYSGAAREIMCIARSYERNVDAESIDLAALCDTSAKQQMTRRSGTINIEMLVDNNVSTGGYLLQSAHRFPVKVRARITLSDASTQYIEDEGVIKSTGLSLDLDGTVLETCTIQLGTHGSSW
jgi:hypothetical protein